MNPLQNDRWSQQRLIGTSFVIGLVLLVFIGVTSYQSIANLITSADLRKSTYETIIATHDLLIDLLNAETGQRGYIITGNERYLEVFHLGIIHIDQNVQKLRELTQDNSRQQERQNHLAPLIAKKLAVIKGTIEIRKKQGFEVAKQHVATMEGKTIMGDIRKVLEEIESDAYALLKEHDNQTKAIAQKTYLVIIWGSLLSFGLVALASFSINRDILKRREAEAERELFFTLSLDMLCIASSDGYFKRINPAFTQTLGWSVEELLARPFLDFVHPDDHTSTLSVVEKMVVRGETLLQFENRYQHKDGSYRMLSWNAVPQPGGMMYATARDVTDLRRSEEELKNRADQIEAANKELEAFSYSVSHDLRAPLRHIDGFVDILMKNSASLDEKSRRYLGIIADSAKKMGNLIDDLLVFSRMGRSELRCSKVNLDQTVQSILSELEEETRNRNIEWKIGQLPEVEADPAMIRLVLVNLISNAVKYTRKRDRAEIEIGSRAGEKNEILFFVRDNGTGFDMQYVHKLFGVFQRLHSSDDFEGTGIGLANVRRIISRHGGKTWAEGKVDQGATFYFSLPQLN